MHSLFKYEIVLKVITVGYDWVILDGLKNLVAMNQRSMLMQIQKGRFPSTQRAKFGSSFPTVVRVKTEKGKSLAASKTATCLWKGLCNVMAMIEAAGTQKT